MKNARWVPGLVIVAVALTVAVTMANKHIVAAQLSAAPKESSVTWSSQIAPLVYGNCTTCHHPGGAGPFSLLNYQDARRWGPQMATVTASRYMPPWLPEPGYGDFADERRLSTEQIALIAKWVATGMAEGDASAAPRPPVYSETWQYGTPDLILSVRRPFCVGCCRNRCLSQLCASLSAQADALHPRHGNSPGRAADRSPRQHPY